MTSENATAAAPHTYRPFPSGNSAITAATAGVVRHHDEERGRGHGQQQRHDGVAAGSPEERMLLETRIPCLEHPGCGQAAHRRQGAPRPHSARSSVSLTNATRSARGTKETAASTSKTSAVGAPEAKANRYVTHPPGKT